MKEREKAQKKRVEAINKRLGSISEMTLKVRSDNQHQLMIRQE